jgi:hypothetical protein
MLLFPIWLPKSPYGWGMSVAAGAIVGFVVYVFVLGTPPDAPSGTAAQRWQYQGVAITFIAALSGGTWLGTRLERRHVIKEMKAKNLAGLDRVLSDKLRFGPNTDQVRSFLAWIASGPVADVSGFAAQDRDIDRQWWRQIVEHAQFEVARRGDLLATRLMEAAAHEAVDGALRARFGNQSVDCSAAAHEAVVDLILRAYISEVSFEARWRRYPPSFRTT